MGVERVITRGPTFTQIVGVPRAGGDPSRGVNPVIQRATHRFQRIHRISGGDQHPSVPDVHGRLSGTYAEQTCSFDVQQGGGSWAAPVIIYLGNYKLTYGIDFVDGASAAATAANIAAAINTLPGFEATNDAETVNVTFEQPLGLVRFEVEVFTELGAGNEEITNLVPSNGFMAQGSPTIVAPEVA